MRLFTVASTGFVVFIDIACSTVLLPPCLNPKNSFKKCWMAESQCEVNATAAVKKQHRRLEIQEHGGVRTQDTTAEYRRIDASSIDARKQLA